jgi:hypothetical protein
MDLLVVRYGLGVKDPTSRLCVRIPPDNLGLHTGINRSAHRLGKKKKRKGMRVLITVEIVFQITFHIKIHVNNIFLFFKNYF